MTQIATGSCLLLVKAEAQREVASVPVVDPGPARAARRRRGVTASASGNFKLNLTLAACHWQAADRRPGRDSESDRLRLRLGVTDRLARRLRREC